MEATDIIQKPQSDGIYARNAIPAIVVADARGPVHVEVYTNSNTPFFEAVHHPDFGGHVRIDTTGLFDTYVGTPLPVVGAECEAISTHVSPPYNIPARVTVRYADDGPDDAVWVHFGVCNALTGEASANVRQWAPTRFLTHQPAEKHTTPGAPEWLTFASWDMKYKAEAWLYPKGGGEKVVATLCESLAEVIRFDASWRRIAPLLPVAASTLHGYYDVVAADMKTGAAVARQRYIMGAPTGREHHFCFVNDLGGVDTLTCVGENVLQPDVAHNVGRFGGRLVALADSDDRRRWEQKTGHLPTRWRDWVAELLGSKQGAALYDPDTQTLTPIVVASSDVAMSDHGQLASASFGYVMAKGYNFTGGDGGGTITDVALSQAEADQAASLPDAPQAAEAAGEAEGQEESQEENP